MPPTPCQALTLRDNRLKSALITSSRSSGPQKIARSPNPLHSVPSSEGFRLRHVTSSVSQSCGSFNSGSGSRQNCSDPAECPLQDNISTAAFDFFNCSRNVPVEAFQRREQPHTALARPDTGGMAGAGGLISLERRECCSPVGYYRRALPKTSPAMLSSDGSSRGVPCTSAPWGAGAAGASTQCRRRAP